MSNLAEHFLRIKHIQCLSHTFNYLLFLFLSEKFSQVSISQYFQDNSLQAKRRHKLDGCSLVLHAKCTYTLDTYSLHVNLPSYISPELYHAVLLYLGVKIEP